MRPDVKWRTCPIRARYIFVYDRTASTARDLPRVVRLFDHQFRLADNLMKDGELQFSRRRKAVSCKRMQLLVLLGSVHPAAGHGAAGLRLLLSLLIQLPSLSGLSLASSLIYFLKMPLPAVSWTPNGIRCLRLQPPPPCWAAGITYDK